MQLRHIVALLAVGLPLGFAAPTPSQEGKAIPFYPKRGQGTEDIPFYSYIKS
ncbi:hypothetical protein BDV28DRAFT_150523 [Aspergillus coremiiformis]|uniref:Uncharacterized protein n=1 Tax=Aspergillus coremiiformis TaxID=138285 RepID=A0A5N6YZR4_9EURO|nr:hypothetical protein BDV28DRAFT_150523 [Aspergillus coremiiformis]